jgi:hypothetical protein
MVTKLAPKVVDLVIPQTAGFTPFLALDDMLPVAIETPDVWTAANITVVARMRSAGAGALVFDDTTPGVQITIGAAANRFIRLDERLFLGATHLTFSADGQTAPRTISVALLSANLLLGVVA